MPKTKTHLLETSIDVFAMNTFSYMVALPIELGISGMSWNEHLQVRLVALLLNTVVARPFGLWRTFILKKFRITDTSSFWNTYKADTLAFLSFQLPLYVGNMVLGGASTSEIISAGITVSVVAGLLGRPYGIYLDWIRKQCGLKLNFN